MSLLYRRLGEGPDLVLLHGWGMHAGVWDGIVEQLAADFTVWQMDLPGYAGQPAPQDYSLVSLADVLAQELPASFHLCGWSLGALVAQVWAQHMPERVQKICLVGATPCFVNQPGWAHGVDASVFEEFARQLAQSYVATLKRFLSLQARSGDAAREVISHLRQTLFARGEPSMEVLNAGLHLLATTDLRAQLGQLRQPALVVAGEYDTLTPWRAGEWLAHNLPQAGFVRLAGAAHAPFLSHPHEFVAALRGFLHE